MIVATAGHVDHGKTALVKALTGVDTDRLPQEKARGISIDLGFAYAATRAGGMLGFVDVPGHERFVRNMVAGVCGIDHVLLVVAADDGVMPQTAEHLAIVDLLGARAGVVALSKIDRVNAARVTQVRAEVERLLAGSGLENAPVLEVSAHSGAGIETLRTHLEAAADAHVRDRDARRGFRFAVDRAFSIAGSGTVVTGTVFDGAVAVGDRLVVSPEGVEVRVRGLQKAGRPDVGAHAGERCALNLAGIERDRVGRGHWVVATPAVTWRFDATLRLLGTSPALRHFAPVHLHVGTATVPARVAMRRGATLEPGGSAAAQLLCDAPVDVVTGHRFIIRDPSGTRTLGGGSVVDPCPPNRRMPVALRDAQLAALALAEPAQALRHLLAASPGGVDVDAFLRSINVLPAFADELLRGAGATRVARGSSCVLADSAIETVKNAAVVTLARFHARSPQAPGMELAALRRDAAPALSAGTFSALLHASGAELGVEVTGSMARRTGHVATANRADEALWQRVKPRLLEAGFRGITLRALVDEVRATERELADFLHRKAATGEVIRVTSQRFYPREVLAQLAALATAMATEMPVHGFTAAQFRDRSGVNRTVAIEILECLDRLGITQRVDDARKLRNDYTPILGPRRMPAAAAPPARPTSPRARPGTHARP
jgi:selenocysteine-specific elongation factor